MGLAMRLCGLRVGDTLLESVNTPENSTSASGTGSARGDRPFCVAGRLRRAGGRGRRVSGWGVSENINQ